MKRCKISLKNDDFDEKTRLEVQADIAKEKKFKPIQAMGKSQTYVYKDIKREFFEKFIKVEHERGADITEFLQKLDKKFKIDVKI